ncbi:DUF3857 domain-containing protein [Maribacter sp. 2304DJ31-5]|uniref:DUF3857 domain-containing protein n=1 Tax=Maribacter sp. 2304DJ31-5 TaxID=3386273 RepID=UPI0039BCA21E
MRIFFFFCTLLLHFFSNGQHVQYQALLLDKSLTDNANAVVRLDEMKINVLAIDRMTYTVNQIVTILNKKGDRFSRTRVGYDKETNIKNINVHIYDKLGNELDHIKKRDFQDLSAADGFSLYTDNRLLYNKYTPVSYPYTVSVSYTIETSDTGFFPPWYFISNYMVSVEKSHYEILYASPDLKPETKEFNLDDMAINKIDEPGRIVYEAANIAAIKSESLGPSFRDIAPRLSLRMKKFNLKGEKAEVHNWKEMGLWMNNALLKNRAVLSEATINKAKSLVQGVADDLEKAKIIYKYMQDNTRYISVQIGIGGWKPISAVDVDRVKYGDCKGLSNYTHALLKAVGVQSYYTVIQAGRRKVDFDPEFSALQGNHAILAIPYEGQYYWIDCTSQIHPFGFVGDFTDDRLALVVTPEGGEIVKTVSYLNEENHQKTIAKYTIDGNGAIAANIAVNTKGIQYDNRFSLESDAKEDIIKHYKEYWDNINNLIINNHEFNNDKEHVVFTETVSIDATNYATKSGERILFVVNAFNKNSYVPDRYRNRKLPLEIQRGYLDEDEYEIHLPLDYELESLPSDKILENEFGSYHVKYEYKETERTIKYNRSLLIKEGNYPKEKYNAYRNFRKEISSTDNAKVVLLKTAK